MIYKKKIPRWKTQLRRLKINLKIRIKYFKNKPNNLYRKIIIKK